MSAVDVAQIASALGALGAVAIAAYEIGGLRRDSVATRAGEIAGVAVATDVVTRPVGPDAGGSTSRWVYQFSVYNPGRFPVTEVQVEIAFSIPVRREHFNGQVDDPAETLEMYVPVIPARGSKTWDRAIRIAHAQHRHLRETRATVAFTAPDSGQWVNTWPPARETLPSDKRLRRYLDARHK